MYRMIRALKWVNTRETSFCRWKYWMIRAVMLSGGIFIRIRRLGCLIVSLLKMFRNHRESFWEHSGILTHFMFYMRRLTSLIQQNINWMLKNWPFWTNGFYPSSTASFVQWMRILAIIGLQKLPVQWLNLRMNSVIGTSVAVGQDFGQVKWRKIKSARIWHCIPLWWSFRKCVRRLSPLWLNRFIRIWFVLLMLLQRRVYIYVIFRRQWKPLTIRR